MKVKELIRLLKKATPDSDVFISVSRPGTKSCDKMEVTEVYNIIGISFIQGESNMVEIASIPSGRVVSCTFGFDKKEDKQ